MKKLLLYYAIIFAPILSQEPWSNWCGNQQCNAQKICSPETLFELQSTIQEATTLGLTVRAFGA